MRLIHILFLILISALLYCTSKKDVASGKIIAAVGEIVLSKQEFLNRFEFATHLNTLHTPQEQKIQFLTSLLAEKILVLEAQNRRLDTLSSIKTLTRQYQKEAVVEALFDQEIEKKLKISPAEIEQAWQRSAYILSLKYFKVTAKDEARLAQQELKTGTSFESAGALHMFRNPAFGDSLPIKILKWNEATQIVEDSVFRLELNQFTGPIQIDQEFYFFKLMEKKALTTTLSENVGDRRSSIIQQIRRKRREEMFSLFLVHLLRNTKATIPREKFEFLASTLESALQIEMPDSGRTQTGAENALTEFSLPNLKSQLRQHLNTPLIVFDDGTNLDMQTVLTNLLSGPYLLNFKSKDQFRTSLGYALRSMIEMEFLTREGTNRDLVKNDLVQSETRMWQGYFTSRKMLQEIGAAGQSVNANSEVPEKIVPPQEVEIFLLKNYQKYPIKINSDLLDKLEVISPVAGVVVMKKHFPNRLVVPPVPAVDHMQRWQKLVLQLYEEGKLK